MRKDWEGLAEVETAEWREIVTIYWAEVELTAEEKAIKQGYFRGHKEVTATKEEEAGAAEAAMMRVAAEEAGSNMGRYDEVLERSKAWGEFVRWHGKQDMGEWEEIVRLHGEAVEDGEEYFLV